MEEELQTLRTEKEMLKNIVKNMITKALEEPRAYTKNADWILYSVGLQFDNQVMRCVRLVLV